MTKEEWIKKIKEEIVRIQKIQHILINKKPTYPFLYPTIENAIYAMANLLAYIEEKNPYFTQFDEGYFMNRQIAMHRSFFSDLHIGIENGLEETIKSKKFQVEISKEKKVNNLVKKIKEKLTESSQIEKELKEITSFIPIYPSFNDNLNSVLKNINGLDEQYIKDCRTYFDGFNIIRNKVDHPFHKFTDSEKERLKSAKLSKVVADNGTDFVMTFEGYQFLIEDVIRFFDNINAHL